MPSATNLLASLPPDGYPPRYITATTLRWVRKVEGISAKEANKRYGMLTAGEWRIKIRNVENNEKE